MTGDNFSYKHIAFLLKQIAGENKKRNISLYETGVLHDLVYDVYGGYEDWAYGASWDKANVPSECEGQEYYVNDNTN